jgi:hypothetical protein
MVFPRDLGYSNSPFILEYTWKEILRTIETFDSIYRDYYTNITYTNILRIIK